jgi:hypothetical protein
LFSFSQQLFLFIGVYLFPINYQTGCKHSATSRSPDAKEKRSLARNDGSRQDKALRILRVDASGRQAGSVSRALADRVVAHLSAGASGPEIIRRDLSRKPPAFVDASWIEATFTPPGQRLDSHRQALAASDEMADELQRADVVVIATPVYNFGVPATLKA